MTHDQRIIEAAKKWAAAMAAAIACKDRDNYWRVSSAEADARHELYAAVKAAGEHTVIEFHDGEGKYYPEK